MRNVVFIPNEIFMDLQQNIVSSQHLAFAYSYHFLICYLYRYCKFIDNHNNKVTQSEIKRILGYSPNNKVIDYIIKKGGVLDEKGYTQTTTDYPITWGIDEYKHISFLCISAYKRNYESPSILNDRNFKIKSPTKGFYRTKESQELDILDGTFYDTSFTHFLSYETFRKIVDNPQLGTMAFYIFGYLKHKNDLFPMGYQASLNRLSDELRVSARTLSKYLKLLAKNHFVKIDHKIFNLHFTEDEMEANVYNVMSY